MIAFFLSVFLGPYSAWIWFFLCACIANYFTRKWCVISISIRLFLFSFSFVLILSLWLTRIESEYFTKKEHLKHKTIQLFSINVEIFQIVNDDTWPDVDRINAFVHSNLSHAQAHTGRKRESHNVCVPF